MTEQNEAKAKLTEAIRERLEKELIPNLKKSKVRTRTVVGMNVLAIAEKQIGKGQPANPDEWERLRTFVKDQPDVLALVDNLEQAIAKVEGDIAEKVREAEADEAKLRAGMMAIIRAVIMKKIAATAQAEDAAEKAEPKEG